MKKCFKCSRNLPPSSFYKHKEMADGLLGKCKSCAKRDVKNRYYDPVIRQRIIAYEKKRQQDPKRKALKLEYQRKLRIKNKGKYIARGKVNNAIRNGRLVRGKCEICGKQKAEAHHADYRSHLKVRWLCRKHHMETENKIPF